MWLDCGTRTSQVGHWGGKGWLFGCVLHLLVSVPLFREPWAGPLGQAESLPLDAGRGKNGSTHSWPNGVLALAPLVGTGGRLLIRIGDKEVEYNPNFRFYITTKLSNPHYSPETSAKTTIVNFAVKEQVGGADA